jgi:hypothetical protein
MRPSAGCWHKEGGENSLFVAEDGGRIIGFSNGEKKRNPEYPHGGCSRTIRRLDSTRRWAAGSLEMKEIEIGSKKRIELEVGWDGTG